MKFKILSLVLLLGVLASLIVYGKGNVKEGEKLFNMHCAACHQKGGTGKVGIAPSIRNRDFLAIASNDFIKKTVKLGRKGTSMVARPDLMGEKIDNIIVYLRALPINNPINVNVDWNKKIKGNAKKGAKKYATFCAACHGHKGEGYRAGGSGPGIGLSGFLDTASDDYIFQTLRYGRVGTPMRPFIGPQGLANLSEEDAKDIIAYLRTLNK